MKQDLTEILKEVLKLPPEARAALAGSLLDSLDETVDVGVEEAWEAEIIRRLHDLKKGKVNLVPWAKARPLIAGLGYPQI